MKRLAQPQLLEYGQRALDQYLQVLQHLKDLPVITICTYLSDLRQFIAWYECSWRDVQGNRFFTSQAIASALLIHYWEYLQTIFHLKPSTVNPTLMSLKQYFAWTRKNHLIQSDPTSPIKFVPKEATLPWHLSYEEEEALVAAVNATRTLRNQAIVTLLLHVTALAIKW